MGRPLSAVVSAAVVAGLVVVLPGAPAAFAAAVPGMPEQLSLPGTPIVGSSGSVGYLSSSSSVSPSGQYTVHVPLDVPAGRAGMQPALSLDYASNGPDGYEGVGWSLTGASSSITRCQTTKADGAAAPSGVHFDWSDAFCLDGQRLVRLGAAAGDTPDKIANAKWRTQGDGFDEVASSSSLTGSALVAAGGPDAFTVRTKDGRIRTYTAQSGTRSSSGAAFNATGAVTGDTASAAARTVWLLTSETDRSANEVDYQYTVTANSSGNEFQPYRIQYTVHSDKATPKSAARYVEFGYENRPDASFAYQGGVRFNTGQRLKTVKMYAPNPGTTALVWQYNLSYGTDVTGRSLLTSVNKCAPSGGCSRSKTFTWDSSQAGAVPSFTETDLGAASVGGQAGKAPAPAMRVVDLNGDGVDDIVWGNGTPGSDAVVLGKRDMVTGAVTPLAESHAMSADPVWPGTSDVSKSFPLDLKGDGTGSVAVWYGDQATPNAWRQKILTWNTANKTFTDPGLDTPVMTTYGLGDFNGDGLLDLATTDRSGGVNGTFHVDVRMNQGGGKFGSPVASTFTTGTYTGAGTVNYQANYCGAPMWGDPSGEGKGSLIGPMWDAANNNCSADDYVLPVDANGNPGAPVAGSHTDASSVTWHHVTPTTAGRRTIAGDFNGDGLEDYLVLPVASGTQSVLLWNTGNGLVVDPHLGSLTYPDESSVQAADVNGDGRADIVSLGAGGISVSVSKGDGTFAAAAQISPDPGTKAFNGYSTTRFGSFDGTGRLGVVRITTAGRMKLLTQAATFTDRITAVRDQGATWDRETVTYSTAWSDHMENVYATGCGMPQVCPAHGMAVVRQVDSRAAGVDPGAGKSPAPYSVFYSYEDPVLDVRGGGYLGFGTVRTWDPQRPVETVVDFPHRTQKDGRFYPYVGRPSQVITAVPILTAQAASGHPASATARVSATHYTYEVRNLNQASTNNTYAVFPTSSYTKEWEQSTPLAWGTLVGSNYVTHVTGIVEPAAALKRTDSSTTYDDYGNATHADSATTGGESQVVDTVFDNRVADWLISLPTQRTVHSISADNHAGVRTTSADYDAQGRLDQSVIEPSGSVDLKSTTTYTVDAYGLVTGSKTSQANVPDRISHTEYAPVFPGQPDERVYPSQVWAEHSVASAQPSTWTAVHPAYGVTVASMDVNGVQAQATFDDLGRLVTSSRDGQQSTSYTYGNRNDTGGGTNGTLVTATTGVAPQIPFVSTTVSDALGRTIQSTATGFDGSTHSTSTSYDVLGRVSSSTQPAPGGTTQSVYDSLDRPLTVTYPDQTQVTSSHTFSTTTTTDPSGKAKTDTTYTVDGEVASVKRTDLSVNPQVTSTTSYTYSPFGLTHTVTDDKGHVTTLTYDTLGRRTILDDPNKGVTTDSYLATGELAGETHQATNVTTTFGGWDDLGRYTTRTSPDGTSTFTWDTAANGIGKLAWAKSPDNIRTDYRYDTNGRTVGTDYTDTTTNTVYKTDQSFDAQGRPDTLTYPAGASATRYAVRSGYNGYGHLATLTDVTTAPNTTLFTITARQPNQALDTATMGTGPHALTLKNTYDSPSGRLHNSKVTDAGAVMPVEDLTYGYDSDGRINSQNDTVGNRLESYTYDGFDQLSHWKLSRDGGATATDTGYQYDTIGNLTKTTVNGALTATYGYGKADGSQPNTQTSLTPTGQAAQNATYDGGGRQTSGDGRTTTYTAFDLPKTVTANGATTTFAYDAFGRKVKETTGTSSTFYVPGLFEHRTTPAGTTDVYYLSGPDGRIGQAVSTNGATATVEYTPTNQTDSTTAAVTPGQAPVFYYNDPFGTSIKADGTPTTPTGDVTTQFGGHENDPALKLINMNGRVYDPAQKQFLTPDPAATPGTSPYPYTHNNPINYTDPTGYVECDKACQHWWDTQTGSTLSNFYNDAETYDNGGAHALSHATIDNFRNNAYGEYINHVRADQTEANIQNLNHWMQHVIRSTNDGYTTPGGPKAWDLALRIGTIGNATSLGDRLRAYNNATFPDLRLAAGAPCMYGGPNCSKEQIDAAHNITTKDAIVAGGYLSPLLPALLTELLPAELAQGAGACAANPSCRQQIEKEANEIYGSAGPVTERSAPFFQNTTNALRSGQVTVTDPAPYSGVLNVFESTPGPVGTPETFALTRDPASLALQQAADRVMAAANLNDAQAYYEAQQAYDIAQIAFEKAKGIIK